MSDVFILQTTDMISVEVCLFLWHKKGCAAGSGTCFSGKWKRGALRSHKKNADNFLEKPSQRQQNSPPQGGPLDGIERVIGPRRLIVSAYHDTILFCFVFCSCVHFMTADFYSQRNQREGFSDNRLLYLNGAH